ncbi:DUF4291 domain-containing protein [Teredinibacter sp. KSP-S5-2]|uniref:DUF4291 domain-containing protein n=1 Tax=Teredinibacter sp. KSP-S5-2 TaxID=3034506 RepID=UPI002934A2C7|nr:DUF4291 domain-containing protein [Teredinibacter sp. KSP-S5-2]WNO10877.1 DUF4291 domain-containing protein [Teredinibacter sp. KSP-S5-2]
MELILENYIHQKQHWPDKGKHIMAQFDNESVVVYQAYRPAIGEFAAKNGFFGGSFSYTRMSWIKPNFLWMMYRCGWASKEGQEVVLAIHLKRTFFENILTSAFPSSNTLDLSKEEWNSKTASSNVRLQWDPDHDPYGNKEERRAVQLGLRNEFLLPFKGEGINKIEDITDFVREQSRFVESKQLDKLITPKEQVYPVSNDAMQALGMKYEKDM